MGALWRTGVAWPEVVWVDVAGRRSDPLLMARRCELASDKVFLRRKNILFAEKNISCGEKYFLRKKIFLAEKIYFLRRKIYFLRKKYVSCGGKYISCGEKYFLRKKIFLAEKYISCGEKFISCGKKYVSCGEKYISCGEKYFLRKKIFLAEKYFCTMLPISFRRCDITWSQIYFTKQHTSREFHCSMPTKQMKICSSSIHRCAMIKVTPLWF